MHLNHPEDFIKVQRDPLCEHVEVGLLVVKGTSFELLKLSLRQFKGNRFAGFFCCPILCKILAQVKVATY